jgi:hypothetical protein
MDDDDCGHWEYRYDLDLHYYGTIPDPGHELSEDDLKDYIDTTMVRVYDWGTEPAGDGMVKLTIEAYMYDRPSVDDAEDAIMDDRMEVDVVEAERERAWYD